ncbi:metal-dependent hydrolase [Acetivibrio cellulolyticus]|uniref:metal-dependent hydrolase n=1 Tax=Acetivibrio cellulolyticus TaxID=35830 RepID=UPI0001E2C78F|nr:metal-dependent hydrolase [Acetivibrio cellulolyticus]
MKGTTHTLIALSSAGLILSNIHYSDFAEPKTLMPFVFVYAGVLICDIDTGSSTISNALTPVKFKYIRKFLMLLFIVAGVAGSIYFYNTKYLAIFVGSIILSAMSITRVSQEIYSIIRKIATITVAIVTTIIGIAYNQPPIILVGLLLGALIFSPHRGYSHSIMAVVVTFALLKYLFSYYKIADYSIYFCFGMLSHVIADMFTEQGVMLLFPKQKKISFPITITTGSSLEKVISSIAIVVLVFALL